MGKYILVFLLVYASYVAGMLGASAFEAHWERRRVNRAAAYYGLTRKKGEDDESLKSRMRDHCSRD